MPEKIRSRYGEERQMSLTEILTVDAPGETVSRVVTARPPLPPSPSPSSSSLSPPNGTSRESPAPDDGSKTIKDLPNGSRPRERLLRCGAGTLTDEELLAVLLRTGRPGQSALGMAEELLAEHGGLAGLLWSDLRRMRRHGLGAAKAATVLAALELGRRLAKATLKNEDLMDRPDCVARYLFVRYGKLDQEVMGAIFVDMRNHLVGEHETFRGTLTRAAVEPRALMREGLLCGAAGMLLFHTHPRGEPTPSPEDLRFTRRMAEAGELMGIRLVDHIIVGDLGTWVSLKQRGAW